MKKRLPRPDSGFTGLFRLQQNAVKWELLKTAIELKVFDHLKEPDTAEGLAARLSTHPENTKFMLKALVSLDWLSYSGGQYQNTPFADSFLANGHDTSIGGALLYMEGWIRPILNGGMLDMVRSGPPAARDMSDESIWETGARASLNHGRCGRALMIAEYVSSLPEFPSFTKMLDMGAGPGIIGIAVATAHPSMECVLFDKASVCRVSDEVIEEYGMQGRAKTICGDYMADPIGNGYDFAMANFTLNFYRDRLHEIMTKVLDALNPGGVFMVTSDGLTKDKTGPAESVISWLSTCLQGKDMSFETGLVADSMLDAGFVSTQTRTATDAVMAAHGPVDIVIGRKSAG